MLDEFDSTGSSDPLTERVADVIAGFNQWCDLAVRRLHEIHRLTDAECEFCAKYLDGAQVPLGAGDPTTDAGAKQPVEVTEKMCVRCRRPVTVEASMYETFERMHYVCFHYEFEHDPIDPDEECGAGGCPSAAIRPHPQKRPPTGR